MILLNTEWLQQYFREKSYFRLKIRHFSSTTPAELNFTFLCESVPNNNNNNNNNTLYIHIIKQYIYI
jgi:hypothetical protein